MRIICQKADIEAIFRRKKVSAALPSAAQDYKLLLKKGQWFSQISPALQSRLLEEATVHKLMANQVVFSRGESFNGLFAVINGMVKIVGYGANDSGKESLLALLEAPEWFGELSFFDKQVRPYDAWAVADATILQLTPHALEAILKENSDYWREFSLLLIHKLRMTYAVIEHALVSPTISRLAYRLLMMVNNSAGSSPVARRVLTISQDQLAHFLAVSRQTTNQLLKSLEQQSVIKLHRNSIEVLDIQALEALSEGVVS